MEMSKKKVESIRIRIEKDLLDRIDKIAGERGRQKFIYDAIVGHLDEELPPAVYDLLQDVDDLKARVAFLESSRPVSMQMSELNDIARNELCLDEIDRKILAYFLRYEGATTPELAQDALGGVLTPRSVRTRVENLNARAKKLFKKPILVFKKGIVGNKRSAWWITNSDLVTI